MKEVVLERGIKDTNRKEQKTEKKKIALSVDAQDCYFWNLHNGLELDLLIVQRSKRMEFEFKFSKTLQLTHSMLQVMNYPG